MFIICWKKLLVEILEVILVVEYKFFNELYFCFEYGFVDGDYKRFVVVFVILE